MVSNGKCVAVPSRQITLTDAGKSGKHHTVLCYKADGFTFLTTMDISLTVCVPFSHGGTVSRVHMEES